METHARKTDPITSHIAASNNREVRQKQIELVTEYVQKSPLRTARELAEIYGADRYMISRRLPDAKVLGVRATGFRVCEVGGRLSQTWEFIR